MINNRSLPTPMTTQLDHLRATATSTSTSPQVSLSAQYSTAMATANAIAASINAQSKNNAFNSPKDTINSPGVVQSPQKPTINSATAPTTTDSPSEPAAAPIPQPVVHVSLAIQRFTADQLYPTPSMADQLPFEIEFDLRLVGCELIQTSGRLLKLPQTAMATAQTLFHRYYYIKSFVKNPMQFYAMAAIFLSSKIEECPRRIRDVMNVFHHIKQVRSGKMIKPMPIDETYYDTKNQVIKAERRMLKELGFCIHVKHPHKIIFIYLKAMELASQPELSQKAWNFMNDSLRTDIFLRYSPENIVCACIYLAARELKISLPQSPPWFTIFGADEETMREICIRILHIYSHKTRSQEELEKTITEIHEKLNEEKRRAREEKCKAAAANVVAALSNVQPPPDSASKKDEPAKTKEDSESVKHLLKTTKFSSSESESRPKFPHQHRSGITTPSDHHLPLINSHSNPYHPMSRHASFNYPYPGHLAAAAAYPDHHHHYQNENYYEMRKNKSSNDLLVSSREGAKRGRDQPRTTDRSRSRDRYATKISNQTNRIEASRSRSRSPWKKEKSGSRAKRVSRSRSRSPVDSVDSERSKSSGRHKKAKKRHESSGRRDESRREERHGKEGRERSDSRHKHHHHHHKSSKSSKSSRSKEQEGESRYLPIYS